MAFIDIKVTSNLYIFSMEQTTVVLESICTPTYLRISYALTKVILLSIPRRRRKESEAFSVVYYYWDCTCNFRKEV